MPINPRLEDSSPRRSSSGYDLGPISASDRERLAQSLNEDERRVLLDSATERPFCGTLLHNKAAGIYACRLCGLPLFQSRTKFESGTGWPSFFEPFDRDHIRHVEDRSHGMVRTEIRCRTPEAMFGPESSVYGTVEKRESARRNQTAGLERDRRIWLRG